MTSTSPKAGWNSPDKIDSAFGWLLFATIGGVVFVIMGMNLIPYAQFFGVLATNLISDWKGRFVLGLLFWVIRLMGSLLGILVFVVIQYLEVRPQLLVRRLPSGPSRARRLFSAVLWALLALGLDVFFCFLFWPPVNSALGWAVFRAGFSWSLVSKWNLVRTFFTLFGGVILVETHNAIKKWW